MIGLQLIMFMALAAPFDLIRDYDVSYVKNAQGDAEVTVSWALQQQAEYIIVCRGTGLITTLPGDATSWTTTEVGFGEFQYSIGWSKFGLVFQWETEILDLGRFTWDPGGGGEEGYILYIATDPADLTQPTENFIQIPGATTLEISLREVMDAGLIVPNVHMYAAMTSYATIDGEMIQSAPTDPIDVEFAYNTYLIPWAPPQPPQNIETDM